MITFAIFGGIMLNVGAFLTYKGMIFRAVFVYLVADLCWVAMAYERGDWMGMCFIVSGMTFGLLAYAKMRSGRMEKILQHNGENDDL
jgi:hypothetical protein